MWGHARIAQHSSHSYAGKRYATVKKINETGRLKTAEFTRALDITKHVIFAETMVRVRTLLSLAIRSVESGKCDLLRRN